MCHPTSVYYKHESKTWSPTAFQEAIIERDALQERSSEQLVQISSLEARLDELRRSDHPMAAEMRQRFTLVQEDLEKKRNELAIKGREVMPFCFFK